MDKTEIRKPVIIIALAFAGWAICGATMFGRMVLTSVRNAQIIHAILAPIFFATISFFYIRKFNYTTPLQTAIIFLSFIVFMDVVVVSLLINKGFEMFASIVGTWIPIASIFISTYLTGLYAVKRTRKRQVSPKTV